MKSSTTRRRRSASRKPPAWPKSTRQVNIHAAKTHLSRLLARVEKGEHITIARDGHPVAVMSPAPNHKQRSLLPMSDPLLNVDQYAFKGPVSPLSNEDIDRIVYGV